MVGSEAVKDRGKTSPAWGLSLTVVVVAAALAHPLCRAAAEEGPVVFVGPNGKETAKGTRDDPYDFQTVLNGPPWLRPGTTVWLLGGVYRGEFKLQKVCSGTRKTTSASR